LTTLNNDVFNSIVAQSIDAIVIIEHDGDIIYWNDASRKIFGYTEEEVLGRHMHDFLPTENLRAEANEKFEEFKHTGKGLLVGNFIQATALHKEGRVIDVQFGINSVVCDNKKYIYAFIRDISAIIDLHDSYEKLEARATTDELTGILNRRAFIEHSEDIFSMARRHREAFSFLMLDVDNFKAINDQHGHLVGDLALKSFVDIVSGMIRAEDVFGRFGGEEFCISMLRTTDQIAFNSAERIRKAVAENLLCHNDLRLDLTVSIGISSKIADETCSLHELMARADTAMYRAKKEGRNTVVSFSG
jgi:diguanylate cyclase (GGDEF)-like protein/PAS domain S-box-containing protein